VLFHNFIQTTTCQLKEARLTNDVVTGKPAAPLSKKVQKAKKQEAKLARKQQGKKRALLATLKEPSEDALDDDLDLDEFFHLDSHHDTDAGFPPNPSPRPHMDSAGDLRDQQRLKCWTELFDKINEVLQIASMILERVNPDLALQYHKLNESLKRDTNKWGEFLSLNESFLPAVAVHFNMAPEDNDFHWDMMSMFSGYVRGLISFKFPA
jgi:5-hydroxyisourate hydrolase-like protein (transthyretin family)